MEYTRWMKWTHEAEAKVAVEEEFGAPPPEEGVRKDMMMDVACDAAVMEAHLAKSAL